MIHTQARDHSKMTHPKIFVNSVKDDSKRVIPGSVSVHPCATIAFLDLTIGFLSLTFVAQRPAIATKSSSHETTFMTEKI